MRKIFLLSTLVCLFVTTAGAQTYPSSFSWLYNPHKDDQRIALGPCNCFATAALAEAWYTMLYGGQAGMAVQHLYSKCTSPNGPNVSPVNAMAFMDTVGIVDSIYLPYGNTTTDTEDTTLPYFANKLGQLTNFPCYAPHQLYNPTALPPRLFFVGGYDTLSFTTLYPTLDDNDRLKRILLNYGPLSLNFNENGSNGMFHGDTVHAYLLYGWGTATNGQPIWYFKDSWPGTATTITYTGDFVAFITNLNDAHLNGGPYALKTGTKNGTTYNQVYVDTLQGSSYVPVTTTRAAFPLTNVPLAIDVNGKPSTTPNQYMCNIQDAVLSLEDTAIFDSYSVTWSYNDDPVTSQHAAINFSNANSHTPAVTVTSEGYIDITATLTLSNGVQVSVTRTKVYVSTGIPFTLVQTYDACSGTERSIQWEIESRMAVNTLPSTITITTPWTFTPAPGTNPSTFYGKSVLPNDILNIDYYDLTSPTGYGIHVTLTDAGYNNIVDGSTVGQSEMACGSAYGAIKVIKAPTFTLYPNPAHSTINVQTPITEGKTYTMKLTDMLGRTLLMREVKGSVDVDVSQYARGVYTLQFISSDKREAVIAHKVVFN